MKKFLLVILFALPLFSFAQKYVIRGTVSDLNSGETLIGATILYGENKGVISDFEGHYSIKVDKGSYHVKVSYVGYNTEEVDIAVDNKDITQDFRLKTTTLKEVEVVGDMAKSRETPVAFTSVAPLKLQEELASRDIPMILNKTPGVYATQLGGGDGDARINIRGFNQRNLGVLLDGIPVNDMENGWVYWSNWFGLDMVTRNIQVQRGLSASKLALPAVGGLMNIVTKGVDANPGASIKQEIGSEGFLRTSIGATSGLLKNGFGVTVAGSYKQGNGWADNTWTKGWFFFLRIDKKIGNHTLSFSGMGAPQQHAQRSYKESIQTYDKNIAKDLGVDQKYIDKDSCYGIRYNENWGYLTRWTRGSNGEIVQGERENLSQSLNYFFKPQLSLRDLWRVNSKVYWSNIIYTSIGQGGGTNNFSSNSSGAYITSTFPKDPVTGLIDYQSVYDYNMNLDSLNPSKRAENIIRSSVNNHYWYGYLSTLNWEINDKLSFSGGIDLRSYKAEHYGEVYDLLGGLFVRDNANKNVNAYTSKYYEGDKIYFNYNSLIHWGGAFAQFEYKNGNWSGFLNLTASLSAYKRVDYFKKRDLEIDGELFSQAVGFGDSFYYNGTNHIVYSTQQGDQRYTLGDTTFVIHAGDTLSIVNATQYTNQSPEASAASTKWKYFPGFTVKGGVNYNLDRNNNIFVNVGYLNRAPRMQNVFDNNNNEYVDIRNEHIEALELGYNFNTRNIVLNFNSYLTYWQNKPLDGTIYKNVNGEQVPINVNGIDAFHKGIEIQFGWKPFSSLQWDQVLAWGDWKWTSGGTAYVTDNAGNITDSIQFDAKGVHVGDAAQFQFMESLRWEIINSLYLSGSFTYYGKNYSSMDPGTLSTPRESWKMPDYFLVDMNAGYGIKMKKVKFDIRASVLNVLDKRYISDAKNNDSNLGTYATGFDATSASVFFGVGRTFNLSLAITY